MNWFENLKRLKFESGMSTHEIAEKSGLPEPTLEKIFSGATKSPGIHTVHTIVHTLGYTLDDLDDDICTKKSPSTTEVAPRDGHFTLEESDRLLAALGLIKEGQQLSDDDLAFLTHIVGLLETWFSKGQ